MSGALPYCTIFYYHFLCFLRAVRDVGGVVKLVRMAKGNYTPKVVKTANQVRTAIVRKKRKEK